jgi:exodeoxyribonuclease VII small subunit
MSEQNLDDIKKLDFETAFTALEENVSQLENEELALEKALALYERGQLLARHCADLLEAAELKMRQLSEEPED